MRLQRLMVHNYRSIRDLDLECQTMVTLLGPNNHGKSNLLSALEFGLTTSVKPAEEDFFKHRDEDLFWVEMTFGELTEQECPHRVNAVRACRFKSGQGLKLPLM